MSKNELLPVLRVSIVGTRGYPSYYGGFETAVRKLAPYLADQGWKVKVFGRKGATDANDPNVDHRIETQVTAGIDSRNLSTLTHGLSAVIRAVIEKPDLVLVMNVANGFWLPLLRARGIPTVVNVDGIEWERDKWSKAGKAIFRLGAKLTARWADRIIVDSVEIGKYWEKNFGVRGEFHPYGGDRVIGDLDLDPGLTHRGYALVVARFVPENSIIEFIDAARIVARKFPVVIVGSSGYGGEIEDQVAELVRCNENVKWLGHVNDHNRLLSLWAHAGVYFHGHTVGGTNPALVQAMMSGAPTVARDTVYSKEVLGDAGVYVKSDPIQIAEQLILVLSNASTQKRLSDLAKLRAESLYTWDRVCSGYVSTFHAAMVKS